MTRRSRAKIGVLSIVGAAAIVLILAWVRSSSRSVGLVAPVVAPDHLPVDRAAALLEVERAPLRRRDPTPAVTYSFGRPNPIIERVIVDKTEVCRGESNTIRVDIKTVDSTDGELKIGLSGAGFLGIESTGSRLPFRLLGPTSDDKLPIVVVFGGHGTHAEQRIPFVRVKDCNALPFITIEVHRQDDRGRDVFKLAATTKGGALSDVAWDFGDGQKSVSATPEVVHDYSGRLRNHKFSEFLVNADAKDGEGRVLHGNRTIELFNPEYRGGS